MYPDELLILMGVVAALAITLLVFYLVLSRNKARLYRRILNEETKATQTLNATIGTTEAITALEVVSVDSAFTPEVLKGQYSILAEITGGGMSKVYLAKKTNIGNDWIIKYVPTSIGKLTNEADILKSLNHISLPKIIDIFDDKTGLYIVQSYVEGMGLNTVLANCGALHEFWILDFAKQLAQVLKYLHDKGPILHLDLKPSNIMVTHDSKIVLIDFGISKMQEDVSKQIGVTVKYAAPEQLGRLKNKKEVMEKRFGREVEVDNTVDVRTDIFSFGAILFEAAVGQVPLSENLGALKTKVSPGLTELILKCLETDKKNRYQTTDELLRELVELSTSSRPKMARTLFLRRLSQAAAFLFFGVSVFGLFTGITTRQNELMAVMNLSAEMVTLSVGTSAELVIERTMPDGSAYFIDPAMLHWQESALATVQDGRVYGNVPGWTQIVGTFRGAEVVLSVHVVWPMDDEVEVAALYEPDTYVTLFAGSPYRERIDGGMGRMEFVSPESLAISESGAIYITDAGVLRRIHNQVAETIRINPAFLRPAVVRTYGNDVYILTSPWQDGDGFYYGIIRITAAGPEGFFLGCAIASQVRDFYVANGLIYFVEQIVGVSHLRTINVNDSTDVQTIIQLPDTVAAVAVGEGGEVFFADDEHAVILAYINGELVLVAGSHGERGVVDGREARFFRPTRLRYVDGFLYVWDFNMLRRIELSEGVGIDVVTVAGSANVNYSMEFDERTPAWQVVLPFSYLTDFIHIEDGILLTDPKRGVIWKIGD